MIKSRQISKKIKACNQKPDRFLIQQSPRNENENKSTYSYKIQGNTSRLRKFLGMRTVYSWENLEKLRSLPNHNSQFSFNFYDFSFRLSFLLIYAQGGREVMDESQAHLAIASCKSGARTFERRKQIRRSFFWNAICLIWIPNLLNNTVDSSTNAFPQFW